MLCFYENRMSPWPAARIGDRVDQIDTPALILELDAFEHNLQRMMQAVQGHPVRLRPHAKSHKCPQIALQQVALGAVGICCQKLSEAAVFAAAGIEDILITNQIVGTAKIAHLMRLASTIRVGVLVDHAAQVVALADASALQNVRLDVYVEVDVGAGRCGVTPAQSVALAQQICSHPTLHFSGLHCYHGGAQHLRQPNARAAAIAQAAQRARAAKQAIEACGIAVEIVTGAGTGTFLHERDSGIYNELQPGSYPFMDRDYADNRLGPADPRFEHALFVHTTVLSRPTSDRAIVDAGLKASSVDSGMPAVWGRSDLRYAKASDEHGELVCESATGNDGLPALGETLFLVPGHCDPTVNLYDALICVRNGKVEAIWSIAARGALL